MRRRLWLFALLGSELALVAIIRVPGAILFREFAFQDSGANLMLQQLIGRGLRPGIDFGYLYGLLPLLVGWLWFAAFQATPQAYMAAMFLCGLGIAWAIADIAAALLVCAVGIIFLLVALPHAIQIGYPNFAQAIEAVLLANALAAQARGRRNIALALATAACFAKPSMGYVYGFVLSAVASRDLVRRPSGVITFAAPAAVTGVVLTVVLSALYGIKSQVLSFSPLAGWSTYRARDFGILHAGFQFLYPAHFSFAHHIAYYPMTVVGFWIACTVWLTVRGCGAGWRFLTAQNGTADEIILTCAVLHLVFIGLLWGDRWSWPYYSYVLVIGGAAATVPIPSSPLSRVVIWSLIVLALTGNLATIGSCLILPRIDKSGPGTAGLLASDQERKEWIRACQIARGRDAVVLVETGAVALMFPQFEPPLGAFLLPGMARPAEVAHKVRQLIRAEVIVERSAGTGADQYSAFPEIVAAMRGTHRIMAGRYFDVYVRNDPACFSGVPAH